MHDDAFLQPVCPSLRGDPKRSGDMLKDCLCVPDDRSSCIDLVLLSRSHVTQEGFQVLGTTRPQQQSLSMRIVQRSGAATESLFSDLRDNGMESPIHTEER